MACGKTTGHTIVSTSCNKLAVQINTYLVDGCGVNAMTVLRTNDNVGNEANLVVPTIGNDGEQRLLGNKSINGGRYRRFRIALCPHAIWRYLLIKWPKLSKTCTFPE